MDSSWAEVETGDERWQVCTHLFERNCCIYCLILVRPTQLELSERQSYLGEKQLDIGKGHKQIRSQQRKSYQNQNLEVCLLHRYQEGYLV